MLKSWNFASMLGLANVSGTWDPCEPTHVCSAISNGLTKKWTRLKEVSYIRGFTN